MVREILKLTPQLHGSISWWKLGVLPEEPRTTYEAPILIMAAMPEVQQLSFHPLRPTQPWLELELPLSCPSLVVLTNHYNKK